VPVPLKIAWTGMRELLGGAPEPALQEQIRELLHAEFTQLHDVHPHVRMHKAGRFVYVQVYLLVPSDIEIQTVDLLDDVRKRIHAALQPEFPDLSLDVIFTGTDGGWLNTSVGGRTEDPAAQRGEPVGTESAQPGVSPTE